MPFKRIEGYRELVYEPEECPSCEKKHDCADCFHCQMCGDDRCEHCLKNKKTLPPKNSFN